jgi:glyoxylase-like metal-dependent hydrolase (beta-lactamase superfamily II)
MDSIELPEYELVDLENVAPGVFGVRILFVNVYGVRGEGSGWTLLDSGLYLSAAKIKSWAEDRFGKGSNPHAIILTHGHFDHVGALEELLKEWNVPVYAHTGELPYLTGQMKYPPPDPSVGGGLMAVMSPLYPRTSADIRDRVQPLPSDGSVPTMPGWRWLHTPGHARGHVSLFRESDRVLLPGDAFCTTDQNSFLAVARQKPELNGPPAYYTPDWDSARESVRKLAALRPLTIAPGHGQPISGAQVADQLAELAENFDRIARPEHGKYARSQTSAT